MQVITPFNPQDAAYAKGGQIQIGALAPCSPILIYNDSPIGMKLAFPDGGYAVSHAYEARIFQRPSAVKYIEWTPLYALNITNEPNSLVIVEVYTPQESVQGTYPLPLVRVTNVGNPGGVVSQINSLNNDGAPFNTTIIEARPINATQSFVSIGNDGHALIAGLGNDAGTAGSPVDFLNIVPGTYPYNNQVAQMFFTLLHSLQNGGIRAWGKVISGVGPATVNHGLVDPSTGAPVSPNFVLIGPVSNSGTVTNPVSWGVPSGSTTQIIVNTNSNQNWSAIPLLVQ